MICTWAKRVSMKKGKYDMGMHASSDGDKEDEAQRH